MSSKLQRLNQVVMIRHMIKQFVATVYIVQDDKVLLIHHRKLLKWLPPGGHLEPNELPSEAAIREAKEETGLDVRLVSQDNLTVDRWNAKSFPRPYLCLLEEIPTHKGTPAHQHIDFVYVGELVGGSEQQKLDEIDGMRWFTLEELESLEGDADIFEETRQVLRTLLPARV